jgi:heme-degrading monooxygenase HmoA
MFARTPEPPYWAVIFSSQRSKLDDQGYARTAAAMEELAGTQPGFLGLESVRDADGRGITVAYFSSEQAIAAWQAHVDHRAAQAAGRDRWYDAYEVRVARVERAYGFSRRPT